MKEETRNLIIATLLMVLILAFWHYFYESPRQEGFQTSIVKKNIEQAGIISFEDSSKFNFSSDSNMNLVKKYNFNNLQMEKKHFTSENVLQDKERGSFKTPYMTVSLRLRGGRLDNLVLSQYRESLKNFSLNVTLLSPSYSRNPYYIDFGWVSANKSLILPTSETLWSSSFDYSKKTVNLTWDNKYGLKFHRIIEDAGKYLLKITENISNNSDENIPIYYYNLISRTGHSINDTMMTYEGPLGYFNKELHEESYENLENKGVVTYNTTGGWFGITDKYWFSALIPNQNNNFKVTFRSLKNERNLNLYQVDTVSTIQNISPGETLTIVSHIFAGVKIVSLLDKYEEQLGIERFDLATDFGWLHFISKPMFYVLQYFNDILGSFALAILLLTVIVKILFFPLANKSYRSMAKMKSLTPKIEEIKLRFKDDKIKMQQEIMNIYKKSKTNPASGCLPMLLQLPIFFALYKVLIVSVEMRHAPFYGWINDLSIPDPMNIFTLFGFFPWNNPSFLNLGLWPLIMGGTMFLQQKLNPTPTDPAQAKIFMFMPIIFTFLFARFPSGLVIYWTWSNILSIIQQWFIMRSTNTSNSIEKK